MKRCPECNTLSADHAIKCLKCNHDLSSVKSLTPTLIAVEKTQTKISLLPIFGGIVLFYGVVLLIYSLVKGLNLVVPILATLIGITILETDDRLSKIEEKLINKNKS